MADIKIVPQPQYSGELYELLLHLANLTHRMAEGSLNSIEESPANSQIIINFSNKQRKEDTSPSIAEELYDYLCKLFSSRPNVRVTLDNYDITIVGISSGQELLEIARQESKKISTPSIVSLMETDD